jgi:hypothetical protein
MGHRSDTNARNAARTSSIAALLNLIPVLFVVAAGSFNAYLIVWAIPSTACAVAAGMTHRPGSRIVHTATLVIL